VNLVGGPLTAENALAAGGGADVEGNYGGDVQHTGRIHF
jgi:hypothetical protein